MPAMSKRYRVLRRGPAAPYSKADRVSVLNLEVNTKRTDRHMNNVKSHLASNVKLLQGIAWQEKHPEQKPSPVREYTRKEIKEWERLNSMREAANER